MAPAKNMIRRALAVLCVLAIVACERTKAPAPGNATAAQGDATSSMPGSMPMSPNAKPWDDELGAMIATPSLDAGTPVSFVRDTANNGDLPAELFSHDDHVLKATLRPGTAINSCAWRRSASLSTSEGHPAPNSWALALAPGIATPLGVDGIEELLPKDSAATVTRINRLVSAIPEDSASAPYRGLPIVVRDAWQFTLADSTTIAVAIAMRSLNVESNPRAQAVTLIAEPDPTVTGQWRTAFWERVAGPEDRVEGMDLLAAFVIHGAKPAVALVREGDAGLQVEIVERASPGVWTVRWSSARLPCAKTP
jgi:hypothetical protein